MRPRTYAIGHKVNSLLSEPSLSTCETWLLPPTCVLCMIRYLEESHGATTSNGRASEDAKYKDQEKKLREVYSLRTTGPRRTSDAWRLHQPDRLQPRLPTAPGRPPDTGRPTTLRATDDRSHWTTERPAPGPKLRMSDISGRPDRPEASDDRRSPDVRHLCIRLCVGPTPLTLSFTHDYIYSSTSS